MLRNLLAVLEGRSVVTHGRFSEVRLDQAFRSLGFTAGSSKATAELLDGFNSGWIEFEKPEATVHGTTPLRAALANLMEQARS